MHSNQGINSNMPTVYPVQFLQTLESTTANSTTGVDLNSQPYIITRILDTAGNNVADDTNIYNNDSTENFINAPINSIHNISNNDSGNSTNIANTFTNIINKGNASINNNNNNNNNNNSTTNCSNFSENYNFSTTDSNNSSYLINLPNSGLVFVPPVTVQPITSATKTTTTAGETAAAATVDNVAKRASRRERTVMLTPEQRQYNLLIQQRNVYLSGFPPDFCPTMFSSLCEVYGRIDSSKLAMTSDNPSLCRGYGFVLFSFADSAKKCIDALNGFVLNGRPLQARRADLSAGPISVYAQSTILPNYKHGLSLPQQPPPPPPLSSPQVPFTTPSFTSILQNTLLPSAQDALRQGSGINPAASLSVPLSASQNEANISTYTMAHILQQQQQQQQQYLQLQIELQQKSMQQQQQQQQQHSNIFPKMEIVEEQIQQIPISTLSAPLTLSSLPNLSQSSVSLMPVILNTENCNPSVLSSLSSYVVNSQGNKGVSNVISNPHINLLSLPSATSNNTNMQLFEVDANTLSNAPTNENSVRVSNASSQLPQLANVNLFAGQDVNVHSVPSFPNCETNHAVDSSVLQSVVQPPSRWESCSYISNTSYPQVIDAITTNPVHRNYNAVVDDSTSTSTSTNQYAKLTVQSHPVYVLYSPESNLNANSYVTCNLNAANLNELSTNTSQNKLVQNVFINTQNQQSISPELQLRLHNERHQSNKTLESSKQQETASYTFQNK